MSTPIWQSKTVWFNIIATTLEILTLSSVVAVVDPEVLAILQGVGNILLRRISSRRVTWTGEPWMPPPDGPPV